LGLSTHPARSVQSNALLVPADNGQANKVRPEDREAHEWYRFVLSYPPHLVRDYIGTFSLAAGQRVLDPFCGTGTTLVECKKQGIASVGLEANPIAQFASSVKVDWSPDPDALLEHAAGIAAAAEKELDRQGIGDLELPLFRKAGKKAPALRSLGPEQMRLLLKDSISPLPLHKTLVLLDHIRRGPDSPVRRHELLALAKALVFSISNLKFGPEVGVGAAKADAPVLGAWMDGIRTMAADLRHLAARRRCPAEALLADARDLTRHVEPQSVDAVITSPPYPNEKDYTRTTRLESVLLGFLNSMDDLRGLKRQLVRSNTRGVYKGDDDDRWIASHKEIGRIADQIESRRLEMGKTSGFERAYPKVTRLYFGGMARHLANLRSVLRPGARLAYVVGDQASYLRVMIRTGQLLARIAASLGYELDGIDLFRTRLATATGEQLREEVVLLRWPG
jgi:hypothetical protein